MEIELIKKELRKTYIEVFLDGRNDYGSHVLVGSHTNFDYGIQYQQVLQDLEDQSLGIAEQIISDAEKLQYSINDFVVTLWEYTRDGEPGYFEYKGISEILTNLMCK